MKLDIKRRIAFCLGAWALSSAAWGQTYTPKQLEDMHIRDHYVPPQNNYDHPDAAAPLSDAPPDAAEQPRRLHGRELLIDMGWRNVMGACSLEGVAEVTRGNLVHPPMTQLDRLSYNLEDYLTHGYPPRFDELKACFDDVWNRRGCREASIDAYLTDAEARYNASLTSGHFEPREAVTNPAKPPSQGCGGVWDPLNNPP